MEHDDIDSAVDRLCSLLERGIECDVQLTQDYGPVVITRVTNPEDACHVPEVTRLALLLAELDSNSGQETQAPYYPRH
jgi:glycerophosphoryl diester phosphodiesterase